MAGDGSVSSASPRAKCVLGARQRPPAPAGLPLGIAPCMAQGWMWPRRAQRSLAGAAGFGAGGWAALVPAPIQDSPPEKGTLGLAATHLPTDRTQPSNGSSSHPSPSPAAPQESLPLPACVHLNSVGVRGGRGALSTQLCCSRPCLGCEQLSQLPALCCPGASPGLVQQLGSLRWPKEAPDGCAEAAGIPRLRSRDRCSARGCHC